MLPINKNTTILYIFSSTKMQDTAANKRKFKYIYEKKVRDIYNVLYMERN